MLHRPALVPAPRQLARGAPSVRVPDERWVVVTGHHQELLPTLRSLLEFALARAGVAGHLTAGPRGLEEQFRVSVSAGDGSVAQPHPHLRPHAAGRRIFPSPLLDLTGADRLWSAAREELTMR